MGNVRLCLCTETKGEFEGTEERESQSQWEGSMFYTYNWLEQEM